MTPNIQNKTERQLKTRAIEPQAAVYNVALKIPVTRKNVRHLISSNCGACDYYYAKVSVTAIVVLLPLLILLLLMCLPLIHQLSHGRDIGPGESESEHFSTFPRHHLNQVQSHNSCQCLRLWCHCNRMENHRDRIHKLCRRG